MCVCPVAVAGDQCERCALGFQDHDRNGTCQADCTTAGLDCGTGTCADTSGIAMCVCMLTCGGLDVCHLAGSCDPATGGCSNPNAPDGTPCTDGNACTLGDACVAGNCSSGSALTCEIQDPCHRAGTCDPATGACSNPPAPDSTPCSDGDACTLGDSCVAGNCTSAGAVACTAQDACHLAGTCDPASGACSNPRAPDGTLCDDGNACTQVDACAQGTCVGSNLVVCQPGTCEVGGCNTATGACETAVAQDGTSCNDGLACTTGDYCVSGGCTGTPNPQTRVDQSQTAYSTGALIHDGAQSFTAGAAGQLVGLTIYKNGLSGSQTVTLRVYLGEGFTTELYTGQHTLPNATGPQTLSLQGPMLTAGGVYSFRINDPSLSLGSVGKTGNPYAGGRWFHDTAYGSYFIDQALDLWFETSIAEVCGGPCTGQPNGAACDDADACTQSDACFAGRCAGGTPVSCAPVACQVGTCAPATGACSYVNAADNTSCDDGQACTAGDHCVGGGCTGTPNPQTRVDQRQDASSTGALIYDGAQSFTAGMAGQLVGLTIYKNGLSGSQTVTLRVYAGEGLTTELYSGQHTLPNVTGPQTLALQGPMLTVGSVYSFRITDPSQSLTVLGKTGNPYAGGRWFYDTAYGAYFVDQAMDLWFETATTEACGP